MIVWFDVLTAKQARIASILYHEGRMRGIDVFITCRRYDYIIETLSSHNVPYICLGDYGMDLREKLVKGFERSLELLNVLPNFDVLIAYPAPEAHRIAWGLDKKIITLTDTTHAEKVNKLTLPLSTIIITPKCIPLIEFKKYIPEDEVSKIVTFNGVFEVMWVSRYRPSRKLLKELELSEYDFVIFRFEEAKASYYRYGDKFELTTKILKLILDNGFTVVVFPRYEYQRKFVESKFSDYIVKKKLIIPKNIPINLLDLTYYSRLVITGGSTFAIEAALLGIPSITYFPQSFYIDDYIMKLGFPLYRCGDVKCLGIVKNLLNTDEKLNVYEKLKRLEDPTELILNKVVELS